MESSPAATLRHSAQRPDFLAIGHITRDLLPDGSWRLGGTVTFATLTAAQLGLRAAIVTSAPHDVLAAAETVLPDIPINAVSAPQATTFENIYTLGGRKQYLRGRAAPLTFDAVPVAWRDAPIVLLGPLAQEIGAELAAAFPGALLGATPQGWLRQWDAAGLVSPAAWHDVDRVLPHLGALILSREDVQSPFDVEGKPGVPAEMADATIGQWSRVVPLIAVTCGAAGAYLWQHGARSALFPGYPAREVDPTGAGDVFATAFLCELRRTDDPEAAVDFANRVAASSVEAPGGEGIPTREMLAARWHT